MADYYDLLDVSRDASQDDIKRAYRKKAMENHPDQNEGSKEAEERFKKITEAYEVLKDPEKRAAYDRYGESGVKGRGGSAGFQGFDFSDAIEIFMRDFGGLGGFEEVFGGRRRGRQRGRDGRKGRDIRVRLPLTLREVARGVTKKLKIPVLEPCEACGGSGAASGSEPRTCPECRGAGEQRVAQRSAFGQFVSVRPCQRCRGEGELIDEPCRTCNGEGRVRQQREIEVEVPAGVSSENFITLRGQGHSGSRGGQRGDIAVLLEIEEDERFARRGDDVMLELPVTFSQAALGDQVQVPTLLDETARLEIPAGIQTGTVLRMRGKGMPVLNGPGRGDQLVRIVVWTPEETTPEQEELFRRLREMEEPAPETIDRGRKGFWSKVKEAFGG